MLHLSCGSCRSWGMCFIAYDAETLSTCRSGALAANDHEAPSHFSSDSVNYKSWCVSDYFAAVFGSVGATG